jgi:1-acyl-sn-glycerol-3-phosphate acyltransferase
LAAREKGGFWVGVAAMLFYPLTWLTRRVYRGAHNIPRQGGGIVVMNHVSHLDPPVDAVFIHRQGRVPRFLAKDSLFRAPIFRHIIGGAGSIPVYRGSADAGDSLRAAREALREGKLIVIYPEGTITRDPDWWPMTPFTGIGRLALDTLDDGVPVIPAARWGTQEVFNGYTKKFRPFPRKPVTIVVDEPMDLSSYRGKPVTATALREVTDLVMNRVKELLAEIREEPAPAEFFPRGGKRADQDTARKTKPADATDERSA